MAACTFDAPTQEIPANPERTHLSALGAPETAKLVAEELRKNATELARLLKP